MRDHEPDEEGKARMRQAVLHHNYRQPSQTFTWALHQQLVSQSHGCADASQRHCFVSPRAGLTPLATRAAYRARRACAGRPSAEPT